MQTSTPVIDIHSHSTLKPYGNSFYKSNNPLQYGDPSCIWTKDRSSNFDNLWENIIGVSRYRQADYISLLEGQVKIVVTSLYPQEVGFFETRQNLPTLAERCLGQFASLFGKKRVEFLMQESDTPYNYFEDLVNEYKFLKQLNNKNPYGNLAKYQFLTKKEDLKGNANLLVLTSIEGAHVFCNGTDCTKEENWNGLEDRIKTIKEWEACPIFIGLAHHFYNGLCTHAKSLTGTTGKLLNQDFGMRDYGHTPTDNEPAISPIGYRVIEKLLNNQGEKRILLDIKHMSLEARNAYYDYLETNYPNNDIPVLASHGALKEFYGHQVNFEEKDILKIYETNGLFGLELDQRVLGFTDREEKGKWFKNLFRSKEKKERLQVEYVWKNLIKIAEIAYQNGYTENPWSCIGIGSDFDGIINPLNNYRDCSKFPNLYNMLIYFMEEYWKKGDTIIPRNHPNNSKPDDIIYQIMYKNAYNFIEKNYLVD